MRFSLRALVAGLLLTTHARLGHSQTDPCENYRLIEMHEGRRERDYQPSGNDLLICDNGINSTEWVRFQRDGLSYQLTNTDCVPSGHCGTSSPVWMMQGSSHPTAIGVDVTAKVCLNYGFLLCCSPLGDITIRWCRDNLGDKFFIYKLVASYDCYSGYCVDFVKGACEPNSHRGPNNICIPKYPPQKAPVLEGPAIIDGTTIEFYCAVAYDGPADMSDDAQFDITFLFDGIVDPDVLVSRVGNGEKALLEEIYLKGHFGQDADTNRIAISEADPSPESVVFRATLPVLCKDPGRPCRACTRVVTEGPVNAAEMCEFCFKPSDWKPSEQKAYDVSSPLRLSAVKDPRPEKPATYLIDFEPFNYTYDATGDGTPDTLWAGYSMNSIAVTYTDSTHGLCSATGDPHIKSFDGKIFDIYLIGQFLLWKSKAPRHFEVHARFWQCPPSSKRTVSCVCGVAVREGNAILGVDGCGSQTGYIQRVKIMRYSPKDWALPTGAFVSSDGANTYFITMPAGAYVKVVIVSKWYLNVYIYGLPEDKNSQIGSCGICGNFNQNSSDDLTLEGNKGLDSGVLPIRFGESYRISRYHSFFDSTPQKLDLPDPGVNKCRCNKGTIDCNPQAANDIGNNLEPLPVTLKGNSITHRRKREATSDNVDDETLSDSVDEEEDHFDYGEDFEPDMQFTWPTPSGMTETDAREFCKASFDALSYKQDCLDGTAIDIEDSIRTCVEDIKITDDTAWAESSIDAFKDSCQFLIRQNQSLYAEGPDGELVPPLDILGKMCPDDCSGRGDCVDGSCNCHSGFTGVDCSLEEGATPLLHYIPGFGRCDLTRRPCKEFRLIASQFKQSDKLTCRVTELSSKAFAGDVPVSHDPTVMAVSDGAATFVTSAEVACKLPEIASQDMAYYQLLFDFSYDGQEYSNKINLTVFDGDCLECADECDEPDNWRMLPGTCIIDGRCVRTGEYDSSGCYTCDPDRSISKWTNSSGECVDLTSRSTSTASTTTTVPSTKSPGNDGDGNDGVTTEFSSSTKEPNRTGTASNREEGGDGDLRIVLIATSLTSSVALAIVVVTAAVLTKLYKTKYPRGKPGPHKVYSAPSEASLSARRISVSLGSSPGVESPRPCWEPQGNGPIDHRNMPLPSE